MPRSRRPRTHLPTGAVALLALCAILSSCDEATREGAGASRPNVLLIVMDTVRARRTGLNGYGRPTTPSLDRIASEGTVYTRAWSPCSWTGPSHASLFTGLRPEHHGFLGGICFFLDEPAVTLAESLADSGYATVCLTGNDIVGPQFGLTQGFEIYERSSDQADSTAPAAVWATDRALELTAKFRDEGRPFFLFVNDWEPHQPYDPPSEVARRFLDPGADQSHVQDARSFIATREVCLEFGWRRFDSSQWKILSDLYDGEIATVDAEVGRLIEGLRAQGTLDETVVVVTSDHGENLGEHDLSGHMYSLHRTVLHVPLYVRFPGRFDAGRRENGVVRLEDVHPTILGLCGVAVPPDLDGLSLLEPGPPRIARAALGGDLDEENASEFTEWVDAGLWRPRISVFDGRWHLIEATDGSLELYDVERDPGERRNLAPTETGKVRELRRLLPASPWD